MAEKVPDMESIMQLAQKVASQIEPPKELKSGQLLTEKDMTKVMQKLTTSVSKIVTPELLEQNNLNADGTKRSLAGSSKDPVVPVKSKIDLGKKRVVEINSDSDSDEDSEINKRTKDMHFTLSVTLEELYNGCKKKIGIRRQKIDKDGSYIEEKKKLSIKIEPGMIDEQTIRFNHMADEKEGYETGDVVVTIDVEDNPDFIRDGNNILIEKKVSLYDCYKPEIYINHINGKVIKIMGDPIDIFNSDDSLKKVVGLGMPVYNTPGKFGDLFIKFQHINNFELTDEKLEQIKLLFPPILKPIESDLIEEHQFEMVTETDLEFLDDGDSEYSTDSDEYSTES